MKVGVFDSGVGGLSVAKAIETAMPNLEVIFRNDSDHVPYGTRPLSEIQLFVLPILQSLVEEGCAVIVIACNTVTTTMIKELRAVLAVPLVAVEPMVKPAATLTSTRVIAICATPNTLASQRYQELKESYAVGMTVFEPDCHDWSQMIETHTVDHKIIATRINEVLDAGADVVVLACTHYHWIEAEISQLCAGRAQVLQPEAAVVRQLKRVLGQLR